MKYHSFIPPKIDLLSSTGGDLAARRERLSSEEHRQESVLVLKLDDMMRVGSGGTAGVPCEMLDDEWLLVRRSSW
jgi:hypothetical protein